MRLNMQANVVPHATDMYRWLLTSKGGEMPEGIEHVDSSTSALSKSMQHKVKKAGKSKGTGTKIADSYGDSSGSMLEDYGFFAR